MNHSGIILTKPVESTVLKSKLLHANGVGLPVQLKEVFRQVQSLVSTVKDSKCISGNQRKLFSTCILISIDEWII